jgi:hypothetical protein
MIHEDDLAQASPMKFDPHFDVRQFAISAGLRAEAESFISPQTVFRAPTHQSI